jgi:hypothetical protein
MSTAAQSLPAAPAAPAAGTQEAVNAAPSFENAAESILEIDNVAASEVNAAAPAEAKPAAAPATADGQAPPDPAKAAADAAAAAAPADPWAIDQALLQKGLANPEIAPLIQSMQTQLAEAAKWREFFPTVADAQAFKAAAPGGIEELKGKLEIAESAQRETADFVSGDPARQKTAISALHDDNPQAFANGASAYLDVLAEKNPQAFQTAALDMAKRGLQAEGVPELWNQFVQAVQSGDDAKIGEAFQNFGNWMDKAGLSKGGSAAKPGNGKATSPELEVAQAKIRELEAKDQERVNKETAATFNTWWEPTQTAIKTAVRADIEKRIDDVLPKNVPTAFRTDLMTRIVDQVENDILTQLRSDTGHQEKLAAVLNGNAWKTKGEDARTQYVNLTTGRTTQLLPFVLAKVTEPYTQQAVTSAAAKNEREKEQAKRVDVSGGGGAPIRPTAPLTPKDMKGRGAGSQLTDEQILDL